MNMAARGVTLLWALRSPCNLHCQYCYFGTTEMPVPTYAGALSHSGHKDASLSAILAFIHTFSPQIVKRVFVAGGEPLIWLGTWRVIAALKEVGCEVIVCTNGLPLQRDETCRRLLDMAVDAVSISLDSFDPATNDRWREDRSGQGFMGVVGGIENLLRWREAESTTMRVGVYTVATQQTLPQLAQTGQFVESLGVDYFIVQPVSLSADHPLHAELSLDTRHTALMEQQLHQLHEANLGLSLGHPEYLARMMTTLQFSTLPVIPNCFGGRDLFFLEPDGSVWDCPSTAKIRATPSEHHRSFIDAHAEQLFSPVWRCRNTDCALFSQDCVNMWQLMAFDPILVQGRKKA